MQCFNIWRGDASTTLFCSVRNNKTSRPYALAWRKVPTSKSNCGIPDRVTVARWGRSLYSRQGIGAISVALLRVAKGRASLTLHCDVPGDTVR